MDEVNLPTYLPTTYVTERTQRRDLVAVTTRP